MEGWKTDKLKNYISVESGYAFKTEDFSTTGIPVVKIGNIVDNTTKPTNGDSYIRKEDLSLYENYIIREGDVLIAMSGNTTCKMGRVSKAFSPSLVNQRVGWIKPLNSEINIDFVYYLLQSESYQNKLWNYATATGQPNLSPRDICKINFYKPSLPEQSAIAAVLSKVDEAIAAVQGSIAAAERLKKSLMQNLLTGRMKPDGTLRKEDEFYVDEKFGRVPKGWEVKRIDEIAERKTEVIDPTKTKEVYDYIGLEHIVPDEFVRCGKGLSNETVALKVRFEKGDLLYGKLRPYLNKVFISDISGVGSTEFIVLKQNEFTYWIYLNFQLKRFLDYTKSMTAGTQHPRASWKDIKHYLVGIPKDEQEREQITKKLLSLEQQKMTNNDKIAVLERLKKSLMQNLLTGRVRVKISK